MKNTNEKGSASAIYGLGFIGAAIYFVGMAGSFGAGVVGILKAIVWPAYLVYEVFQRMAL